MNKIENEKVKYVAFLRGINVGGHHKVPMTDLKKELAELGMENIVTLLNSGNVIFDSTNADIASLEKQISKHLEGIFGFSIPTILRRSEMILDLLDGAPFEDVTLTKEVRLYMSFLWKDIGANLQLPWTSEDGSFKIIEKRDRTILSVLDLSISKTPKGMEALERHYGKEMTTRNWNTIVRVGKKLKS